VMMDNLSSHKGRTSELIEAADARLLFLPPYIPDFNPCMDVYGPRLIATLQLGQDRLPRLLTYIRLLDAARYIVAASPDGFSRASTSMAPRHWPRPCRSTHQVQEAIG
jgi:hypothetical protein